MPQVIEAPSWGTDATWPAVEGPTGLAQLPEEGRCVLAAETEAVDEDAVHWTRELISLPYGSRCSHFKTYL